jgi:hypothetical protein
VATAYGREIVNDQEPQDWRDWIPEAHQLVEAWEAGSNARLLSTREVLDLAERLARAMHNAYALGAKACRGG